MRQKWGAPNLQIQRPTDPTPHLKPSEESLRLFFENNLARQNVTSIVRNLDGPNRQSPIASVQRTRSTLAGHSAGPRGTNTTPMNANRAIRIAAQRTQGLQGPISLFSVGRYDRQRTLVIRIAAITLASDSAITLARFRPAKIKNILARLFLRLFSRIFWRTFQNNLRKIRIIFEARNSLKRCLG